jgi:hypothetical protein
VIILQKAFITDHGVRRPHVAHLLECKNFTSVGDPRIVPLVSAAAFGASQKRFQVLVFVLLDDLKSGDLCWPKN